MAEGEPTKHLCSSRAELLELLTEKEIIFDHVEHPHVYTVETMMPHLSHLDGLITKNLFLKDKKKKLYLLTCLHDREVRLADVGKAVGASGGLRLADEALLLEHLGVKQGCVTPFAIVNDQDKRVKLLLDSALTQDGKKVFGHPLENNATIGVSTADLNKFFLSTDHEPTLVDFTKL